jgi:hypothetical protein
MNEKVLHLQSVNNLITAAVKFSERHGVDANDKYQRHHRHRRPTRRVEKQTKTAKSLKSSTYKNKPILLLLLLLLLLLGFYLKTRSPIHIVCSSLEPCKTTKYM